MDLGSYQAQSRRTMSLGDGAMANAALGVGGEAGEVIELVKKSLYHGRELDRQKLQDEIGDVLFYLAFLCEAAGISLETAAVNNISKLRARYPEGFVQGGGNR